MKLIIDSIEDGIAKLEKPDLTHDFVPVSVLPDGAREGSVLLRGENGELSLDCREEDERRKRIADLQKKLRAKKKRK